MIAQGYWKAITKMPNPVSEAQIIFNNSNDDPKFYIIGGYSDVYQSAVTWIQEYDINANSWKTVGELNSPRKNFSAALWDSTIVIVGGAINSFSNNHQLEYFSLGDTGLAKIVDENFTRFSRVYGNCTVLHDTLLMMGGNILNQPYLVAYNLTTKKEIYSLTYKASEILQDEMFFIKDNKIFLFGGIQFVVNNKIKTYSLIDKKINEESESLIDIRAGGKAVYNSSLKKGFILGGYNEGKAALNSVEEILFSPDGSFQMNKSANLQFARKHPMAANYANTVFVFGGTDADGKVVADVEYYVSEISGVDDEQKIPFIFELSQNYPNPFNPETNITFSLPDESHVKLRVFNILGQEVASLINEVRNAGVHTIKFNASNLVSGMYIYKIEAGDFVQVKKMLLMK